jgi:hypothetical protein
MDNVSRTLVDLREGSVVVVGEGGRLKISVGADGTPNVDIDRCHFITASEHNSAAHNALVTETA